MNLKVMVFFQSAQFAHSSHHSQMLLFSALLCMASCAQPYKIDTICLVDSTPNTNCDRLAELYTEEFWNNIIPGSWPDVQQYLGTIVTVTADQAGTAFSQTKSPYVSVYVYTNGMSLASPMNLDLLSDHTVLSFVGQQQSGLTLAEQEQKMTEAFMHQVNVVARLNKNADRGRQIDNVFAQTLVGDVLWPKVEQPKGLRHHFEHKLYAAKLAAEPTITLTATQSDQMMKIDALLSIGCNIASDKQLFIPYCAIDDPNKLGRDFIPSFLTLDAKTIPSYFQPHYLWTNVSFWIDGPLTNFTMNETHWIIYANKQVRLVAERYPADLTCLVSADYGNEHIYVMVENFPMGTNATGMNVTIMPESPEFQLPFPFNYRSTLADNVPSLTLQFGSSTVWDSMVTNYPIFGLSSEDLSKITVLGQPTHCHIFKSQYMPPVRPSPVPALSGEVTTGSGDQGAIEAPSDPPNGGNTNAGMIAGIVIAVIVVIAIVVVVVVVVVKKRKERVYAETSGDQPLSTNEPPASTGDQPAQTEDKEPSVAEPEAPANEHHPSIGEQNEPAAGDRPPSPNNAPPETDDNPQ